jgi:hypothetical protein
MGRSASRFWPGVVVLVCAMVVAAAFPTSASAALTMTVQPSTGLADGQSVVVNVSGASGTVLVGECTADLAICPVGEAGNPSPTFAIQQQILTPNAGLVDCAVAPGTCVIAARDATSTVTAPLAFAHPAPPTFVATPSFSLVDRQSITVAARGFVATTLIRQCDATLAHCDTANGVTTAGAFALPFVVHRVFVSTTGTVDCGAVACVIAGPSGTTTPISLVTQTASVTPTRGVADGQVVDVVAGPGTNHFVPFSIAGLSNAGVGIAQCVAAAASFVHPDSSLLHLCGNPASPPVPSPTSPVSAQYTVRTTFPSLDGSTTIHCGQTEGDCLIAVLVSVDLSLDRLPVFSFPLTFRGFAADATAPSCALASIVPGPPKQLHVSVLDAGSGLRSIQVKKLVNGATTVPTVLGITTAADVVTTKLDQTQPSTVQLEVTDAERNTTRCDPIVVTVVRGIGNATTLSDVDAADHVVTVHNGSPGLRSLLMTVDGKRFHVALRPGRVRSVDIGDAMTNGSHHVIVLSGRGAPKTAADVVIADRATNT